MIKKLALAFFFVLFAGSAYGQQVLIDFSAVTPGTNPSQAQLNSSIHGTPGSGAFTGGAAGTSLLTVQTVAASPFFGAATTIGGISQLGNGNLVLRYAANGTPGGGRNFQYGFRTGSKAISSMGFYFCTDFDNAPTGNEYSNVQITAGGANGQNLVLGPNPFPGGLEFENNGGNPTTGTPNATYQYHGGNCTTDSTFAAWVYVTLQYNGANPNQMKIYTVAANGALTLVNSWTGNSAAPVNLNPGSMVIGITGNEGEGTGNIYWKNFIVDDVSGTFPLIPNQPSPHLWSGVLDPARAMDWNTAGVVGGIPDGSWAQCVNAACTTVTSAGGSSTAAQINAAWAGAPNNTKMI